MIQEVKIDRISRQDKEIKGKKCISVGLYVDSKWINGLDFDEYTKDWKEGDTVKIDIYQNGNYTNFRKPTKITELEERIVKLEEQVKVLLEGK